MTWPPSLAGVFHARNIEVVVEDAEDLKSVGPSGTAANARGKAPTDTEVNIINITNMESNFSITDKIKIKKYINLLAL